MVTGGFSVGTRPRVMSHALKFKADSEEAKVSALLDAWLEGLRQGQVKLVRKHLDKDGFTVQFNGRFFVVAGPGRPRLGTVPEHLSLESIKDRETFHYTGPGCFGVGNLQYHPPEESQAPQTFYGPVAMKAARLIRELGKLAGYSPRAGN